MYSVNPCSGQIETARKYVRIVYIGYYNTKNSGGVNKELGMCFIICQGKLGNNWEEVWVGHHKVGPQLYHFLPWLYQSWAMQENVFQSSKLLVITARKETVPIRVRFCPVAG